MKILLANRSMMLSTGIYRLFNNIISEYDENHSFTLISDWTNVLNRHMQEIRLQGTRILSWGEEHLLNESDFDLIIASNPKSQRIIDKFQKLPIIYIVSDIRPADTPVIDPRIKYICFNHEILNHLNSTFNIPVDRISIIKDIAELLVDYVDLDELTIVIPHYNRVDKLSALLPNLKSIKHIIVSKGGTFSQSCNQGFCGVKTPYVCFLNDDVNSAPNSDIVQVLRKMLNKLKNNELDIIGCDVMDGVSGFNWRFENGIKVFELAWRSVATKYPTGACLMMKSSIFARIGGFKTIFKNGCEDIAFFIDAEDLGYKIGKIPDVISHITGSSEGRYDHARQNIIIFNEMYKTRYVM